LLEAALHSTASALACANRHVLPTNHHKNRLKKPNNLDNHLFLLIIPMKHFTIVHVLFLLLFLIAYQCAQAQGYILTHRGDSLQGEIKPFVFGPDKRVQVVSSDKKKQTFTLFEVREFGYKGDKYHPVKLEEKYTFMKLLKSGYLSLYGYQLENQATFDGRFLLKRDGKSLDVPNLGFRKLIARFLEDCSDLSQKIDNGDFGKKDLDAIVDQYNQCVNNRTVDHTAIVAESAEQREKISPWNDLENKVKAKSDFAEKENALEMIADIKARISRNEKVPNFVIEGLKSSLAASDLQPELAKAVNELNSSQ
jgi:hypothetical protein